MEPNPDKPIIHRMNYFPNPNIVYHQYKRIEIDKITDLDIGKEIIVFTKYSKPINGTYHMDFMINGTINNINEKYIYIYNSLRQNIKSFIKDRFKNKSLLELHIKI